MDSKKNVMVKIDWKSLTRNSSGVADESHGGSRLVIIPPFLRP